MAFEKEVELAKLLAEEAGAVAIDYQRRGVTAETKSDESPVTAADRACEQLIVEGITRAFPQDGILGEEGANRESSSGRRWIIDPIDGTRDFVRGTPLWAVLIGLEQDGEIVAGAAYCPRQNLLEWAAKGSGAWANGERIHASAVTDVSQAVMTINGFQKEGVLRYAKQLVPWLNRFWSVRSMGGALDVMMTARGVVDGWIELSAAPWDLAPFKIILEEAGATLKSFKGEPTIYGGNAYACTPALEPHIRELLYSDGDA